MPAALICGPIQHRMSTPHHVALCRRRQSRLDGTACERICERNAAPLRGWRGTRRDGRAGRFFVTCAVETLRAIGDGDGLAHNAEIAASNPVPLTLSRSAACEVRCQRTAGLKDRLGTAGNRLVCLFRRSIVRCNLLLGLASGCGMVGCRADVMREADRAARLGRPRLRWWLRVMWRRRLAG